MNLNLAGWVVLGVLIGLAALSKVSGLALLPLAGLGLAWASWRRRDGRLFLLGGICLVGAAALVAGWWYYRNWRLYGDPLGWNMMIAIAHPRPTTPTLLDLWGEREGFIRSYWGLFGAFGVAAPGWFYALLNGLALLAASGLVIGLVRRLRQRRLPGIEAILLAGWPLLLLAGLVRWTRLTMASQGRLIFPGIACLSLLLVLGWAELARQTSGVRRQTSNVMRHASRLTFDVSRFTHHVSRLTFDASRLTFLIPIAIFASLSLYAPFAVIAPAYARPPLLTAEERAALPNRLDYSLGGQMALLGYRVSARELRPGGELSVTLYWQAEAPMGGDYSVFVHLLDENQQLVAQRDAYPGRGLFPTSQWQPGEAIADTYILPIPAGLSRPTRLQLVAGLYRLGDYRRLPVADGGGRALGDQADLGEVQVRPSACERIEQPLQYTFGGRIALVGYNLDRTALRAGETLHLTLFWQALAPVDRSYTVFTHVLGPGNNIWAQDDGLPLDGTLPTNAWPLGQVICDTYELTLELATPAGSYEVEAGMYLRETLTRLEAVGPQGRLQDDRVVLGTIYVE